MPSHYLMSMTRAVATICLAAALALSALPARAQWATDYNIIAPEPAPRHRGPERHEERRTPPPALEEPQPRPQQPQAEKAPPKGKYPRGSSVLVTPAPLPPPLHYNPPPVPTVTPAPHEVPPSVYVPQTGLALPNLPMPGNGPGGSETSQDRALRCAHQAGVYGPAMTGDRNAYIGSCINQ